MRAVLKVRKLASSAERRTRERRAARDRRRSRQSELLHRATIEQLSEGIVVADHDGRIVDANLAAGRILGTAVKGLSGSLIFDPGWHPLREDGAAWPTESNPAFLTLRSGEPCAGVVMGLERRDGRRIWISVNTCAVVLPGAQRSHGVVASFSDITAARDARTALAWSEQRFRDLTELSADWYWEQDEHFRFVQLSPCVETQLVPPSMFIGRCHWELPWTNMTTETWATHRAMLERREPFRDLELTRRDAQGELQTISVSGKPLFDAHGGFAGYRGVGSDITRRRRAEELLAERASHDQVTGLCGKALLLDRLARAIERARRGHSLLAVMILDLDQLRGINESLGHAVGDEVLREVARRLLACVRAADTVARPGGDEFAMLLEGVASVGEIPQLAHKLLDAVSAPMAVSGHNVLLSASMGVSTYPVDGQSPDALLRDADLAMYYAKHEGRNSVRLFANDLAAKSARNMELKARLRLAIERDEFVVHYQPQLDVSSGRIVGVEALVRWNSADLGLVPPASFIAIAEETGLIVPIGDRVLREACRQMKAWQLHGCAPASVAVNLSARQFRREDLAKTVEAILHEAGLEPGALELEVSESTVMRRVDDAGATLAELDSLGVGLAVDDFGTGFSSLACLERFPLRKLKVDQSFVRELRAGNGAAAIVSGAIALARRLGRTTVAEGVETRAQLELLRDSGCEQYQGYLFSRPLAQDEIGALLAANRRAHGARG